MGNEQRRQDQIISLVQTIARQALELPLEHRSTFIRRSVTAIRRDFDRKYGADPDTADAADRLENLIVSLITIAEETGGLVGHA